MSTYNIILADYDFLHVYVSVINRIDSLFTLSNVHVVLCTSTFVFRDALYVSGDEKRVLRVHMWMTTHYDFQCILLSGLEEWQRL